ncbi:MAG: ATP-binding protein [Candidatus Peribacteraceae bacterium]|nr:ATP-binding protein [Candidatus Peribacteraceae bacterium]
MLPRNTTPRPDVPRMRTTILWRSMRQFALLATFSVLLFSGTVAIALRPLPASFTSLFLLLGILIFLLGIALAYFLARGLTQPIIGLSGNVGRLGPDHWAFRRSVHSHDEVEALDRAVGAMAARLEQGYRYLQSEVAKRTEELRRQYAKDHAILTSIHHGVLVADASGRVVDANPAALEMLHMRGHRVLGQRVGEVLVLSRHQTVVPEDQHPVLQCLKKHVPDRPRPNAPLSIVQEGGKHIPVMLVASPLFAGRRFLGVIAVFHDVTEERQVDYMKSEFISLASHQLRTPLSTITWYLELLGTDDQEKLSPTQRSYLEQMTAASQRMTHLIDALLHASKLEGQNIKAVPQNVNIATLVHDATEGIRPLAKERKISLEVKLPAQAVMLSTDPTLLLIILQNLLSNAVKYSEAGGIVAVALTRGASGISIMVRDTGIGIPAGEQKRVFTRLFRGTNVRKIDTTGSGLGLFISHTIVEQLGGRMRFKSREGKGTQFTIQLPLHIRKKRSGATTNASPKV